MIPTTLLNRLAQPRGRRSASAARSAVVLGVVMYFAGQIVFNVAVRKNWLPLHDPVFVLKFENFEKRREFFQDAVPGQPRVLLLGSSRAHLSFDAARFGRETHTIAYNFATPGGGPLTNDLYLRRLLAEGVRAEVVLLEIHPGLFLGDLELHFLNAFRLREDEREYLQRLGHPVAFSAHYGWRRWLAATHIFRLPLLNRYASHWSAHLHAMPLADQDDAFGFMLGLHFDPQDRPKALERTIFQYRDSWTRTQLNDTAMRATRATIANCKAHGMRVIAFVSAESSELRAKYKPESQLALQEFLDTLGVPVIPARDVIPDEDFADGHHLMPAGAVRFTEFMADAYTRLPR